MVLVESLFDYDATKHHKLLNSIEWVLWGWFTEKRLLEWFYLYKAILECF